MKKKILLLIELIFIVIIVFSLINIISWYISNKNNDELISEIKKDAIINEEKDEYKIDFKSLKEKNSDTIAYFIMKNPNIEYPVVKYKDNNFYLNHNFNKEYNKAGWIFANYINKFDETDKNIILFGHNMKNGSMFGGLYKTLENDWINNKSNQDIILVTEKKKYNYKIFSVYRSKVEEYYLSTKFSSDNDYELFLNTIKKRSVHDFNIDLDKNDKILTLSTCSGDNYRVVVHAKLVNEK